jgi:molecular chaperone Hsp33
MAGPSQSDAQLPLAADDAVIVFRTFRSGIQGRLVRLGAVTEKIIGGHAMPDAASEALGEALVLAALLGSALQDEGSISVQTRTDGVVSVLYAECKAPGMLRGYARYDAEALPVLADSGKKIDAASVLGNGHLAITVDQGDASDRYQGVITLDGGPLDMGAAAYFEQRENFPTFVRLAIARHYAGAQAGLPSSIRWRGGGLMIQKLESDAGDTGADDEPWSRVRMLTATVEDHELLDPALEPERLLLRLFHEEGVIVERVVPLNAYCRCSRDRIKNVLASFGAAELADMRDGNGKIAVTCEFCAAQYSFEFSELDP